MTCIQAFKSDLSTRHKDNCPWNNVCIGDQIANPLFVPREDLLQQFEIGYNSFDKLTNVHLS